MTPDRVTEDFYPCPECGEPVTGLAWFGNGAPTRIWLPTWTPAGS